MKKEHYQDFKAHIDGCMQIIKQRQFPSREASLAITKLQEAWMWFQESNEDTCAPYQKSGD